MNLVVGTGSTWSLRAWMCLQLTDVKAQEQIIDLTAKDYKQKILALSPTGLVPALLDGNVCIHDSLAITEYLNEVSDGVLYPKASKERALARSLVAEMHAGFMAIRTQCPFSLQQVEPLTVNDEIAIELARAEQIFSSAKLPFMFDSASAVDAFYALLAYRLDCYGIRLNGKAGEYQQSLIEWPLLVAAIDKAIVWQEL